MNRPVSATSISALLLTASGIAGCSVASAPATPANLNPAGALSTTRGSLRTYPQGVRLPAAPALPAVAHAASGLGWLSQAAKSGKQLVYVADQSADAIEIYNQRGQRQQPIGQITQGLYGVSGLFVDAQKNLYATNFGNGTVVVYPPGKMVPSLTLTGAGSPTYVVVARDGTVYVSNYNSNTNGTVLAYPKGKTSPSKTIVTFGANAFPEGLALDSKANLYVAYNGSDGEVVEFTKQHPAGINLGIHVGYVGGLTIDKNDNLLLVDQQVATVDVYPQGKTSPSQQISGFTLAYQIALDKANDAIFVTDPGSPPGAARASYPAGQIDDTIQSGLKSAYGVATSPDGSN